MKIVFDSEAQKNEFILSGCPSKLFLKDLPGCCLMSSVKFEICKKCWEAAARMEVKEK